MEETAINPTQYTKLNWMLIIACFQFSGCAYEASPFNETSKCWEESEIVGFHAPWNGGCDEGSQILADENGKCWYFNNGCNPDGFNMSDKCDAVTLSHESQLCPKPK